MARERPQDIHESLFAQWRERDFRPEIVFFVTRVTPDNQLEFLFSQPPKERTAGHVVWMCPQGGLEPKITVVQKVKDELLTETGLEEKHILSITTDLSPTFEVEFSGERREAERKKGRADFAGKGYIPAWIMVAPDVEFTVNPNEIEALGWFTQPEAAYIFSAYGVGSRKEKQDFILASIQEINDRFRQQSGDSQQRG